MSGSRTVNAKLFQSALVSREWLVAAPSSNDHPDSCPMLWSILWLTTDHLPLTASCSQSKVYSWAGLASYSESTEQWGPAWGWSHRTFFRLEGEDRGLRESVSLPPLSSYPRPRVFPQQHNHLHLVRHFWFLCFIIIFRMLLDTFFHSTQNSGELLIFEYFSLWSG